MLGDRAKLLSLDAVTKDSVAVTSIDEDKDLATIRFPDGKEDTMPVDKLCRYKPVHIVYFWC